MTDKQPTRTVQAEELRHDESHGYYLEECPNCEQDCCVVYLGGVCNHCAVVIEVSEVEVSWDG